MHEGLILCEESIFFACRGRGKNHSEGDGFRTWTPSTVQHIFWTGCTRVGCQHADVAVLPIRVILLLAVSCSPNSCRGCCLAKWKTTAGATRHIMGFILQRGSVLCVCVWATRPPLVLSLLAYRYLAVGSVSGVQCFGSACVFCGSGSSKKSQCGSGSRSGSGS
jgi:hypothetical protein